MGVRKLRKIIEKYAPEAIVSTHLASLANCTVAVDVPIFMWRFSATRRVETGFVEQIRVFRKHNIAPIYVFDGRGSIEAKEIELERRRNQRDRDQEKLQQLRSEWNQVRRSLGTVSLAQLAEMQDKIGKMERRLSAKPSGSDYAGLQQYLSTQGIEWLVAEGDAEKTCAELVGRGRADYVITEDFDALPFLGTLAGGQGRMVTKMAQDESIVIYDVGVVLSAMELTVPRFIDMCILAGCDYAATIRNLGPMRAAQFMRRCECIEDLLPALDQRFQVPADYDFQTARRAFGLDSDLPRLVSDVEDANIANT